MRVGNPIPRRKARIEIIPLIDVMFFLLAAFMMVSLTLQRLRTLPSEIPAAASASAPNLRRDLLEIDILRNGDVFLEGSRVSLPELHQRVADRMARDAGVPVYLRGDPDTLQGHVMAVLDMVHAAGARRVAVALDGGPGIPEGRREGPGGQPGVR
jgi:biopolymer transport protein ExbD